MLESDYIHAASPKPPPPIPVRVFRRSQLGAALRQHARPIVIEDQELARLTTVGAWGVCRRHDVLRDWAVLRR